MRRKLQSPWDMAYKVAEEMHMNIRPVGLIYLVDFAITNLIDNVDMPY